MGLARWTLGLLALLLIGVGAPALSEGPVPFDPPAAAPVAASDAAMTIDTDTGGPHPDLEDAISPFAPGTSLIPHPRDTWVAGPARWDDHPDGGRWSHAVMQALRGPGAPLLDVVPQDIAAWCPAYPQSDAASRAAFWTGLVSALAWHESTHRPEAVGGGGQWFGLVQIYPPTARFRQCQAQSGAALQDGPANLRCAIRIMGITVPRDQMVAQGNRGVAADWGPMHSSQSRKREDIRSWVARQPYCVSRTRPAPRPERFLMEAIAPSLATIEQGPRPVARP
jgi:hypothetical protein